MLNLYRLNVLFKNFPKFFFKFIYRRNFYVIDKIINFLIKNFLKQNLTFYRINRVSHFVRNRSINELEKLLFSGSYIIHNLRRNINYLYQILLFVWLVYRLHFELNILIFTLLLLVVFCYFVLLIFIWKSEYFLFDVFSLILNKLLYW
jgi:hypothetical protein